MSDFGRNNVKQLKFEAHFHGETIYRCLHCEKCSEYYDIIRRKIGEDRYQCPNCNKIVKFKLI